MGFNLENKRCQFLRVNTGRSHYLDKYCHESETNIIRDKGNWGPLRMFYTSTFLFVLFYKSDVHCMVVKLNKRKGFNTTTSNINRFKLIFSLN